MEGFIQSAQWRVRARAKAPSKSMAEPDDQQLLRQLARGNESAFATFYERYQGRLYRFALHMSGNSSTAEEVAQEVFMIVIANPKAYDPAKGSVAGYLFGIARNLTRRSMERSQNYLPILDEGVEEATDPADDLDLLAELSQAESLECLRKAVLTLPEQYREVVVLCELEEMTYPEAAGILDCSPGTIASRLHRARAMLKAKLKGLGCAK